MTFVWTEALAFLLLVPGLVAGYVCLLRRRKRFAIRHPNLASVREALGPGSRIRRHVPPALMLLALSSRSSRRARPLAQITLPSHQRTIMLAIDVSLSMRAKDVPPNRMVAAQEAAKTFVQAQPEDVRIGIVTFAGSANLVQPPTRDRDELVAAIDQFKMQMHTAIGSGIILSLATLFPDDGLELEQQAAGRCIRGAAGRRIGAKDARERAERPQAGVHAGRAGVEQVRRDHPADRRAPHDRPGFARRRAHGRRARRAHFHRRLREPQAARRPRSTATRCTCVSTRRC